MAIVKSSLNIVSERPHRLDFFVKNELSGSLLQLRELMIFQLIFKTVISKKC